MYAINIMIRKEIFSTSAKRVQMKKKCVGQKKTKKFCGVNRTWHYNVHPKATFTSDNYIYIINHTLTYTWR